jgi:hypothetical protein
MLSVQLQVGNAGDASLSGAVTAIESPFGVSSGSPYLLVSGATSEIAVVFTAADIGAYTNDILLTGGDGAPVSLRGVVVPEPAAAVAAVFALLLGARRSNR